jgi:hypothetical protein
VWLALVVGAVAVAALGGQWLRHSSPSTATSAAATAARSALPADGARAGPPPPRGVPISAPPIATPASPSAIPAATAAALAPPAAPTATAAHTADLAELLQSPPSPQMRWVRFKSNPAIVVIEYPNLHEQGLAMNRLAAMFEKRTARRDRVPSDAELADLMRRSGDSVASFYQGHDYPGAKVARFFSLADAQRLTLNAHELQLRSLMLETGLMTRVAAGSYQPAGSQAVVSFTGVQPDDPLTTADERVDALRREAVLRHELSHGQFFTDAAYRAHCMRFWRQTLREGERRLFTNYLKGLDYNPADEELMANETQALLMHTPDGRAFSPATLGVGESTFAQWRNRFMAADTTSRAKR